MDHKDLVSIEINQKYDLLKKEKKQLMEQESCPKIVKKLERLEKELLKLKRLCKRNIIKNVKKGTNLTGSLEFELFAEDAQLKIAFSKWARKRGYNFEKFLLDNFSKWILDNDLNAYCYRNYTSKFAFQPFDLVLFRMYDIPIFIECKASGIVKNKNGLKIAACKRRYVNYNLKTKIEELLIRSGSALYFAYRHEENKKIYFLDSSLIFNYVDHLFTKGLRLKEGYYLELDLNSDLWPKDVLQKLDDLKKAPANLELYLQNMSNFDSD